MSSKKWCVIAAAAAVFAVLAICLFNIFTDPFGVFGDEWYSYNATQNPRIAKIEYLKKNHDKYDSYIIGCSSTSSYPVEDLNKYLNAKFYNLIMYGADMKDVEDTVYYITENYTVKNIVLNLYIANGFAYDFEPDSITGSMHPEVDGSSKAEYYAKYTFLNPMYGVSKLMARLSDRYLAQTYDVFLEESGAYDKRKRDAEPISSLKEYYTQYPVFENYPVGEYPLPAVKENAESIFRIKEYLDKKGINLILVNAPIYYDYFNCIPKEDIEEFYTAIAQKVDFWDFSVSSVSLEPRYFYDETHFRNDVGSMALARIFNDSSVYMPDDFGVYVTKDNVSEHISGFWGKSFDDKEYTKRLPVLLYHHIDENVENDMIVSPKLFAEHMEAISKAGYTAVTLDEISAYIKSGIDLPPKPVLITFDDGYMSNYKYAYSILAEHDLKGVIFAVGETFGKDTYPDTDKKIFPHFGSAEMMEMEKSGVIDVQCHTYQMHQNAALEKGEAYENILKKFGEKDTDYVKRVKADFSEWEKTFNKKIKAIAYPHGLSDLLSQAIANEYGIELSFSTNPETDTLVKGIHSSGYALGRYTITEKMSASDVLELIR